jgi:hypothetical protein
VITPEQLAKSGTEHGHQTALFCWAAMVVRQGHFPCLQFMFAIPNGGERNIAVAGKLKAEGVKRGVFDIFLPYAAPAPGVPRHFYNGLFVEMKIKPNKLTDEQQQFMSDMLRGGYQCAVCYSWMEARDAIIAYIQGHTVLTLR